MSELDSVIGHLICPRHTEIQWLINDQNLENINLVICYIIDEELLR